MGQENPEVVKITQNLLTCHILEVFSVSNNFLSGLNFFSSTLVLYRKHTQKFNFPTD